MGRRERLITVRARPRAAPGADIAVKIVFLGTPAAAVPAFEALLSAGHDVALVVTRPDRPVGRSDRPQPPPVKLAAQAAGVPVQQPRGVRGPEFLDRVASIAPDVLVVVAYGRILGASLLRLPPHGAVNVHFSLLPAYRGAAPVQWALVRGETTTGVTTMLMNEYLDEGDLLLQREIAIEAGEHAPALESRLAVVGAGLLIETLAGLEAGSIAPRPQDPHAATFAPLLAKADGEGDPALAAHEIEGRVRGFDPWPGVWFARQGRRVRIADARAENGPPADRPPGTLAADSGGGLWMACGGGTRLRLLRIQPAGSREMTIADAQNGRRIEAGDRLDAVARR